jgi:hypothetical protein
VGNRLHQFAHLVFQILIGHDQRSDGRAQIAATGRNRLIDRGFEAAVVLGIRR